MEKFTKLTGVAAPMPVVNIDTDMIIPKDYLKTIKRTGLGTGLFAGQGGEIQGGGRVDVFHERVAQHNTRIPR